MVSRIRVVKPIAEAAKRRSKIIPALHVRCRTSEGRRTGVRGDAGLDGSKRVAGGACAATLSSLAKTRLHPLSCRAREAVPFPGRPERTAPRPAAGRGVTEGEDGFRVRHVSRIS